MIPIMMAVWAVGGCSDVLGIEQVERLGPVPGVCETCEASGHCVRAAAGSDPNDDCGGEAVCDGKGGCGRGVALWSRQLSSDGEAIAGGLGIDKRGDIISAGVFSGRLSVGSESLEAQGLRDIYVVKHSADGELHWARRFGGAGDESGVQLSVVPGGLGILLAGSFDGSVNFGSSESEALHAQAGTDIFIMLLNGEGEHLWSTRLGGSGDDSARALRVTSTTYALIAGHFDDDLSFDGTDTTLSGGTGVDGFVARLTIADMLGEQEERLQWAAPLKSSDELQVMDVLETSKLVMVVGGVVGSLKIGSVSDTEVEVECTQGQGLAISKFDLSNGKPAQQSDCQSSSGWVSPPGGAVHGGATTGPYVAGTFGGALNFEGSSNELAIQSAGKSDAFVVGFGISAESQLFARPFGDGADDRAGPLDVDSSGQIAWAGAYQGAIDLGGGKLPANTSKTGSVFVAKHGSRSDELAHRWSRGFGASGMQVVDALMVDEVDNVLMTGSFSETIDFGSGALQAPGAGSSVFLVKLSP